MQQTLTAPDARFLSLDSLRGFAVLGILAMNIIFFAFPEAVYTNPVGAGPISPSEQHLWVFSYVVFSEKFYTLFSLLFGAGIAMMADKANGHGLHYRRMSWLLIFGLLHGYLLWSGDILFVYAVCGMLVYLMRNLRARWLIFIGLLLNGLMALSLMMISSVWDSFDPADIAEMTQMVAPTAEYLADERWHHLGSWWQQTAWRAASTYEYQIEYIAFSLLRNGGIILIGMGLFKLAVVTAQHSRIFYLINGLVGVGLGWWISYTGSQAIIAADFSASFLLGTGSLYNYWAALITAWGYVSIMMLLAKQHSYVARLLAPVGRMALTNYLTQSLICGWLFYGWGLGWYESLTRAECWLVVVVIWAIQITWSHLWLRYFRYGPMEWLWRSLSYARRIKLSREN